MIAHHLSTLHAAGNIIVISDGVVAEEGAHQHLLSLNGLYAGLYNAQLGRAVQSAG